MDISYLRKQAALVLVPPESHPEIRVLEQVVYLGDAPRKSNGRMENFNRDRKEAEKRCTIKKD